MGSTNTNTILPATHAKVVNTRTATVWVDDAGFIVTVAKGHQTLADAKENMGATAKLLDGRKMPVLLDYTNIESLSRDARLYYGNKESGEIVAACAIVTASFIGKLIGNFSIGLNKASVPIKLFTEVASAKAWLKQFINDSHKLVKP